MLTDEARQLLQQPLIVRLSTINSNGYPHTVPLWFDLEGDDLIIISDRNTAKVRHIARNPNGALQIGGDNNPGYLFKGTLTVEPDPDYKWLVQVTRRYEEGEQAEKDIELWRTTLDMIIIRLHVTKVIKVF